MRSIAILLALLGLPTASHAVPWSQFAALKAEADRYETDPPDGVAPGAVYSVQYHLTVANEIRTTFSENAQRFLDTAAEQLARIRAGQDPFASARGFVVRGYPSAMSETRQGYSIYVPRSYDPSRPTPLLVMLHGGSSNHSLFLAVVFGNDVEWASYHTHWWDLYRPQWDTDFLVMAPDGMGQVMWRWMGERDVLDAIEDVRRHYNVDPNRIYLNGLSNGGVGAYSIGMRHAWRFAAVLPMAGAASWLQYHRGPVRPFERPLLEQYSAMHMLDNAHNTVLRFYHGVQDRGPMSPAFPRAFSKALAERNIAHSFREFDTGHDVLYWVHRRGKIFGELRQVERNPRPAEVWLESRDYRAARQHWIEVARFAEYPRLARVHAKVEDGQRVLVETDNADRLALHWQDIPVSSPQATVVVDGDEVPATAPDRRARHPVAIVRRDGRWRLDDGRPEPGLRKVPGLSGPITDVLMDRAIYAYGTKLASEVDKLRRSAEIASRGWPLWSHAYHGRIVPEDQVTVDLMRRSHIVVFGTVESSDLIARAAPHLPIRPEAGAIVLRDRRLSGHEIGLRMIYPNPLADSLRYMVVQTGTSTAAVQAGNRLPDFVPDYVVFDGRELRERPRLVFGRSGPIEAGFFDSSWRLPAASPAP